MGALTFTEKYKGTEVQTGGGISTGGGVFTAQTLQQVSEQGNQTDRGIIFANTEPTPDKIKIYTDAAGVLRIEGSLAVEGGVVMYAEGEALPASIWEKLGEYVDGVTVDFVDNKLVAVGGGGGGLPHIQEVDYVDDPIFGTLNMVDSISFEGIENTITSPGYSFYSKIGFYDPYADHELGGFYHEIELLNRYNSEEARLHIRQNEINLEYRPDYTLLETAPASKMRVHSAGAEFRYTSPYNQIGAWLNIGNSFFMQSSNGTNSVNFSISESDSITIHDYSSNPEGMRYVGDYSAGWGEINSNNYHIPHVGWVVDYVAGGGGMSIGDGLTLTDGVLSLGDLDVQNSLIIGSNTAADYTIYTAQTNNNFFNWGSLSIQPATLGFEIQTYNDYPTNENISNVGALFTAGIGTGGEPTGYISFYSYNNVTGKGTKMEFDPLGFISFSAPMEAQAGDDAFLGLKYNVDNSARWGTIDENNLYIPHVGWIMANAGGDIQKVTERGNETDRGIIFANTEPTPDKIKIYTDAAGVLRIEGSLAVEGGVVMYAEGAALPASIWDQLGLYVDDITIKFEGGKLVSQVTGGGGGGIWGTITGTITDQSDLITYLSNNFSAIDHTHAGVYAAIDHVHDYSATFSAIDHTHAGVYAAIDHVHDYSATFSAIDHVHDYSGDFAALNHTHDKIYYNTDIKLEAEATGIKTYGTLKVYGNIILFAS